MEFFNDISKYQGWLEFNTPRYGWVRAEECGTRIYHVYVKDGEDGAFIKSYTIRLDHRLRKKEAIMQTLHAEMIDADREEDYERN